MKSLDSCKCSFYSKKNNFKEFEFIGLEEIRNVLKNVKKIGENFRSGKIKCTDLDFYYKTLAFLTSPNAHLTFKTFDEKILFLIRMVDPKLEMLSCYLSAEIMSSTDIEQEENEKKRQELRVQRAIQVENFKRAVREKIGFYDEQLLKYEKAYFNRYLKDVRLMSEVKIDYLDSLLKNIRLFNLRFVSEERFSEINQLVMNWLSLMGEHVDYKTLVFHLLFQSKKLGVNTYSERILFLVLAIDPDLTAFQIYQDECRWDAVEKRTKDALGFYDKRLIEIERKVNDKFLKKDLENTWIFEKKAPVSTEDNK